jgi:uncharacterized protein DUF5995
MPARTIDEVITRLEGIIEHSIATSDRLGYFAALYNRVTEAVRQAIQKREFQDNERMERLDVLFANRYLAAYDAWQAGELPSRSWLKAFLAAQNPGHIVLQHLLIGMNAHINLDLGVAAARIAPGSELSTLRTDFDKINQILATETPVVEQELDEESPVFSRLTHVLPKLELKVVGFGIDDARVAAWDLATQLAPLTPQQQLAVMERRDGEAALLGDAILADGLVIRLLRAQESQDVAENIRILSQGEFRHAVPASASGSIP